MRKFLIAAFLGLVVAAAPFTVQLGRAVAAYTQTLLADGTSLWFMTSVSSQLVFNVGSTLGLVAIDPVGGLELPISTVAGLPACAAAQKGAQRMVSDATTPTYNGVLTGGSTVVTTVFCNGTAWLSH